MTISLTEIPDDGLATIQPWSLALMGPAVDERGLAMHKDIAQSSSNIVPISYSAETLLMEVASQKVSVDEFEDCLTGLDFNRVLIEATTLGFVEIFQCILALHSL